MFFAKYALPIIKKKKKKVNRKNKNFLHFISVNDYNTLNKGIKILIVI